LIQQKVVQHILSFVNELTDLLYFPWVLRDQFGLKQILEMAGISEDDPFPSLPL